jgi:hypothetical protein
MRKGLFVLCMLLGSVTSAPAQVSVGIAVPGISIGINMPVYPAFVPVPGYPVYYAPHVNSNFFFYDGMYWVYQRDNWYASSWYNGPWWLVGPEAVPLFVLRVPVRYYRQPPPYFHGWRADAPPRWGEHWGHEWEQRRAGWDQWNRGAAPRPAPLPKYQQQYSGTRYPAPEQQVALQSKHYRRQPQDPLVQQHYQAQRRQAAPQESGARQGAPTTPQGQAQQKGGGDKHKSVADPAPQQQVPTAQRQMEQPQQRPPERAQQPPSAQSQDKGSQGKGAMQEPKQGQETGHDKGDDKGGGPNK